GAAGEAAGRASRAMHDAPLVAGSGAPGEGDGPDAAALLDAQRRPAPRIAYGRLLVESGASAAIDLSDGLFGDLAKLCERSGVGARVNQGALPVPPAVRRRFPDTWLDLATRGGEDYELLFTADGAALTTLRARCAAERLAPPVVIGAIEPAGPGSPAITLRRAVGSEEAVRGGAFDHFAS